MALPALVAALLPTIGKIADKVIKDPAAADEFKFKMAEMAQNGELQKIVEANKMFELEVRDRESARDMAKTVGIDTQRTLSYGIMLVWAAVETLVLFGNGKELDPVVLARILGMIDAAFMLSLAFWFGSSHGSKSKNKE